MEVMRDHKDQCVVICSIENFDPMGVHTGDSITVAPAMTLTDKEYQAMRDASFAVIREIGVETGGSNIQFAVDPETGRMVVIEMNPRVSRSSALASKATGFPIAKIAAKLAVGYTLDEIQNDITRETPASFEPTHRLRGDEDPPIHLREIPGCRHDPDLVDEVGGRGDGDRQDLQGIPAEGPPFARDRGPRIWRRRPAGWTGGHRPHVIRSQLGKPNADRIFYHPLRLQGWIQRREDFDLTTIDPWFLAQLGRSTRWRIAWRVIPLRRCRDLVREAKEQGFSDAQLAVTLFEDAIMRPSTRGGKSTAPQTDLPPGRYLRGRIRGLHSLLLFVLRRRGRGHRVGSRRR